ncbi:MAG: GntR family transcriptional regulator [Spirochaetales bacterium]|nr:GntR family transcriptional regulator [Spirochaetales bacterium]
MSNNLNKTIRKLTGSKNQTLSRSARKRIIEYIRSNEIQPGDALPTEAAFVELLQASRHTVREALMLMEQENLIYKIQGKGTFLKKRPIHIESGLEKLESITEVVEGYHLTPGTQWIGIEIKNPTDQMIEELKLQPGEKVITFKRVRTANTNLASYCVDTMPLRYFETIPREIDEESLFSYLEKTLGIYIESAVSYIVPTLPTGEMTHELGVPQDQLFLLLQQVHYDSNGVPMIFSNDYFQPDIFKFKVNRTR